jgi:hypothetical protein
MPDGRPDLQGMWNFSILTPLERPAQFAGKATLSEEETAQFERQVRRNADGRAGLDRAYDSLWLDLSGKVIRTGRSALIVDPPDGRIPALTPAAQAKAKARAETQQAHSADGPEDRPISERCLLAPNEGPPILPGPYNNNLQIVQTREYVVIATEQMHDARIVPLDGRHRLPATIRRWQGDSRGHWEGDTLVIETTNFIDHPNIRGTDDGDENLRLVERLTRIDADTLNYEATIDDPSAFTRPWTVALPMKISGDAGIYEYACHEGNYAMGGILRGARAQERETGVREKK